MLKFLLILFNYIVKIIYDIISILIVFDKLFYFYLKRITQKYVIIFTIAIPENDMYLIYKREFY